MDDRLPSFISGHRLTGQFAKNKAAGKGKVTIPETSSAYECVDNSKSASILRCGQKKIKARTSSWLP
jgi:hypothetical protein